MTRLSQLLHDLIDHAVPQGNRRGELHSAVPAAVAELLHVSGVTDPAEPEGPPAHVARPVLQAPKVAKADGAAGA